MCLVRNGKGKRKAILVSGAHKTIRLSRVEGGSNEGQHSPKARCLRLRINEAQYRRAAPVPSLRAISASLGSRTALVSRSRLGLRRNKTKILDHAITSWAETHTRGNMPGCTRCDRRRDLLYSTLTRRALPLVAVQPLLLSIMKTRSGTKSVRTKQLFFSRQGPKSF